MAKRLRGGVHRDLVRGGLQQRSRRTGNKPSGCERRTNRNRYDNRNGAVCEPCPVANR